MSTRTKVWLIIAVTLVLLGGILFAGVMSTLGWDFTKLSTEKFETNTYEISEAFDAISMDTDTADIVFAASDDGICKVVCYEQEYARHSAVVEGDTLIIRVADKREWYQYIGINFSTPKITVYLPKTEYTNLLIDGDTSDVEIPNDFMFKDVDISLSTGDVEFCASASKMIKIKTSTGDICVENISAGALDLSVSTGKVTVTGVDCGDVKINVSTGKTNMTDIRCKNLLSSGDTGDISLKNVIATEKFSIERSTGDVKLEKSDAAEIYIETDTGDVTGTLLTEKVFIAETDTGRVDVPKTTTGGKCEIETDTGNIKISISN